MAVREISNLAGLSTSNGLRYFLHLLIEGGFDEDEARHLVGLASDCIRHNEGPQWLFDRWYDSLRDHGVADYTIYAEDDYLAEVWACWQIYSKKYLGEISKPRSKPPRGIAADLPADATIVDVGNGLGMTTASLRQIFPNARLWATNLRDTTQWRIAEGLAKTFNFEMVEQPSDIGNRADLCFASEYFEHFEDPLPALREIVEAIAPRRFLIANTFNGDAIGHFDTYLDGDGTSRLCTEMGRLFSAEMKSLGYVREKTGLWNNRPAYWIHQ